MTTPDDDLLYGVPAIAEAFRWRPRQVYHLKEKHGLPTFKMGKIVCAKRSEIRAWIDSIAERAAATAARPTTTPSPLRRSPPMTAINVLLQRDAAHLVTDAAWYDLDGVVQHFGPKAQVVGHWPGAIATRGPGLANALIATEAGLLFADLDAFAEAAPGFLAEWCEREAHRLAGFEEQAHVEIIAVGWSKARNAPRAIFVQSRDAAGLAAASGITVAEGEHAGGAFEVLEIEPGYVRPVPSAEALAFYGVDPEADFDAMPSLTGYAKGLVCAQRELREPILPGEDPVCFVGGYVMQTIVTRDGVSTSKVASFPDEIGTRIHATRGDMVGAPVAANVVKMPPRPGLTRKERRAAEAAARKGR